MIVHDQSRIPDIVEWARTRSFADRPWLMLGKGPSYTKLRNVDTSSYGLLSLNHVVRERPVDIAHIIDLDVVHSCADAIERNAGVLWMPAHPHIACKPTAKPLWDWCDEVPLLRKLAAQGRLAWYNASSWKSPERSSPVVDVRFFSAEAALSALALCGAKIVRSLGIDGGCHYAPQFDDLKEETLLSNGHPSFDLQFEGFARTIRRTGVFYAPLTVESPVRVFVGTDASQAIALKLLEYSIKRYASLSVTVVPIDDTGIPVPANPAHRPRTGFSFSRFKIPQLCGHRGRAIYLDADMQVFSDIRDLWTRPLDGAHLLYAEGPSEQGRIPQYSVMLLDSSQLGWDVDEIVRGFDKGHYTYAELMQRMCIVPAERQRPGLPVEWNSLEHFEAGRTRLLHYTDMPTQPWVSAANQNGQRFYETCKEALAEGFLSADTVNEEVALGHVSPDFPGWIGLPPPRKVEKLLEQWKPPYQRFLSALKSAKGR